MIRRSVLDALGGFRTEAEYHHLEDTGLWTDALAAGIELDNVPEFHFAYQTGDRIVMSRRDHPQRARNEVGIRLRYRRRAGLPWYTAAEPLLVYGLRFLPTPVVRFAYAHLRRPGRPSHHPVPLLDAALHPQPTST
jgi:hypothetical protein